MRKKKISTPMVRRPKRSGSSVVKKNPKSRFSEEQIKQAMHVQSVEGAPGVYRRFSATTTQKPFAYRSITLSEQLRKEVPHFRFKTDRET